MKKSLALLLLLGLALGFFGTNETHKVAYDDLPGPHAMFKNYF